MTEIAMLHVPRQLVLFRVGEAHYGFDIAAVDEILPTMAVTAMPGAPGGVLGLLDVRKRVVPVFDLHWKFGVPAPASNPEARFILVAGAQGSVAMLVDEVEEVVKVSRDDFQTVAAPGNRAATGYLKGVLRHGDRLVLWVDHLRLAPAGIDVAVAA